MADQAAEKIQEAAARVAAEAEPAADKAADKLVAAGKDISAKGPKVRSVMDPHCTVSSAAAQFVLLLQSLNTCPQVAGTLLLPDASLARRAFTCTVVLHDDPAAGAARHSCLHKSHLKCVQYSAQVMGLAMSRMPCCLHCCAVQPMCGVIK